jgi:hypothetical protein
MNFKERYESHRRFHHAVWASLVLATDMRWLMLAAALIGLGVGWAL